MLKLAATLGAVAVLTLLLGVGAGLANPPPAAETAWEEAERPLGRPSATQLITATVRFAEAAVTVAPGNSVSLLLLVEDAENLSAWELLLSFDPDIVAEVDFVVGPLLASTGRTVVPLGTIEQSPGQVFLGAYSYGTENGVSGSGVLAWVTLHTSAEASGQTDLALEEIILAQVAGAVVTAQPAIGQGAQLMIANASVGDTIFFDTRITNGVLDPGEDIGVGGVLVVLTDTVRAKVHTRVSGADGRYLFDNLLPGDYQIATGDKPALLLTTVSPQAFSLAAGQADLDRDFGYVPTTGVALASFSDTQLPGQAILAWQVVLTEPGADTAEFHVWRAPKDGEWRRLTTVPVAAEAGGNSMLGSYGYCDNTVQPGQSYLYRLELVEGGSFGPWQVNVPAGWVYLPLVTRN